MVRNVCTWVLVVGAAACTSNGADEGTDFTPSTPTAVGADSSASPGDATSPSDPDAGPTDPGGGHSTDGGPASGGDSGGGDSSGGDSGGADSDGGDSGAPPIDPDPTCTLTCEGHGVCVSGATQQPMCLCEPGYYGGIVPTSCKPAAGTPCETATCLGGTCTVGIWGGAVCQCPAGTLVYRDRCVPENKLACRDRDGSRAMRGTTRCSVDDSTVEVCHDGNGDGTVEWIFGATCADGGACSSCRTKPCPEQPCPVGTACVEQAHERPLGVCVTTCDCNNCTNCGPDNSDGRWNDWQESCGAPAANTPTQACRLPCPNAGDGCIPYEPAICWPMEGCFSGAP